MRSSGKIPVVPKNFALIQGIDASPQISMLERAPHTVTGRGE
jgi:hypothetical protein